MPRPPQDGAYAVINRDGTAAIVQFHDGSLVDFMLTKSTRRPKRRTTRYLGTSFCAVLAERDAARERRVLEIMTREIKQEIASAP